MQTVVVAYIPALHSSYPAFFEQHAQDAQALYLIDDWIKDEFPLLKREIRALTPKQVKAYLKGAKHFPAVKIASRSMLKRLGKRTDINIIMSDEYISDYIKDTFFSNAHVTQIPFFLRFDEKIVKAARKEVPWHGSVTTEQLHREVMDKAVQKSNKNSEWFLKVGAALIINDPMQPRLSHNIRMPSPHSLWTIGDIRMYVEYGTDVSRRTTLHAEQAAIAHAARDGVKIEGASMYVTTFPCPDCVNNIAEAGIRRIYFKEGFTELASTDTIDAYGIEVIKVN